MLHNMVNQKFFELIMGQNRKKAYKKFCISREIDSEFTVPETPEQTTVAERLNRTVVGAARCFLRESKAPKNYWV